MPNYYQILSLQPDATTEQIQIVCDDLYHKWRRLVTHHQPEMVEKANQNLAAIEKIRTVLLDPVKREAYNAGIGLGPTISELADPDVDLGSTISSAPRDLRPVAFSATEEMSWSCDHCGRPNRKGSIACKSCGNVIGRQCPNCTTIYKVTINYCPICNSTNSQPDRDQHNRAQVEYEYQVRRTIRDGLAKVEVHLQAQRYRLAQTALAAFEGLGKSDSKDPKQAITIICPKTRPEWSSAEILAKNANQLKNKLIWQLAPLTGLLYAIIGLVCGMSMGSGLLFMGMSAGAGLGLLGPIIYYSVWGGETSANRDLILAILSPLGLAIVVGIIIAIVVVIFQAIIFVVGIIALLIGLLILGAFLGGG